MRRAPLLALLIAVSIPATASGQSYLTHHFEEDGTGWLMAKPMHQQYTWERCPPGGGPCAAYDDGDGDPQMLRRIDVEAGSVFRLNVSGEVSESRPWRGRLKVTEPPRVEGRLNVGEHVKPVAARWEGGWGEEDDWLQLQVCKTADGAECKVIFDQTRHSQCGTDGGRHLPARYEGWWLRVVSTRISREGMFPAIGYGSPEAVPPKQPSGRSAAAVAGQIGPGQPPPSDCGSNEPRPPTPAPPPPAPRAATDVPSATIDRRWRRSSRRLVATRITCPSACAARVLLHQLGRTYDLGRRRLSPGTTSIRIPAAVRRRLRLGALHVKVVVDGATVETRRAELRR